MKKLAGLTLVALFAYVLVSCAGMTPKLVEPGGKIGEMTVEKHSTDYPSIWSFCDLGKAPKIEPYTSTIDCEVPVTRLKIDFGWGAKDETLLTSNLEAMVREMYIDGHQINFDAFDPYRGIWDTGPAMNWTIDLVNPTPGKHILRVLWKTKKSIDDGFYTYPPGTYEDIVNFTVREK